MHPDVEYWVEHLNLGKHPEGGFYRETYRSEDQLSGDCVPDRFEGAHNLSTAIYFLLTSESFSAFHRLQADEVWHFYAGTALTIYCIRPGGELHQIHLGKNPENGQQMQATVNARQWFAADVDADDSYALVGCTTAPGFEFEDFELGERDHLLLEYPQHQELIHQYTRQ